MTKITRSYLIHIMSLLLTSCSSIDHFGKANFLSLLHYNGSGPLADGQADTKRFEYVKNGKDSCFENSELKGDIYTVKHKDLKAALYLLNVKTEKWLFEIPQEAITTNSIKTHYINVSPLQQQITYEYALCEIKFLGFSYDYDLHGINNYASFRYLSK